MLQQHQVEHYREAGYLVVEDVVGTLEAAVERHRRVPRCGEYDSLSAIGGTSIFENQQREDQIATGR